MKCAHCDPFVLACLLAFLFWMFLDIRDGRGTEDLAQAYGHSFSGPGMSQDLSQVP